MAKARVSALAKEVGLQSKQLIEWLNNNGEYVKTPSSTIEAPAAKLQPPALSIRPAVAFLRRLRFVRSGASLIS